LAAYFVFQPDRCEQNREMGKITRHPAAENTAGPKDEDHEVFSKAAETTRSDRAVEMRVKLRSGAYRVDARRLADKLLRRR
jgi:anti-sigma28 factor (negative regulator of flagellin synthesis)